MDSIETDRLILRPFTTEDGPSLHTVIGNDPDMTWESTSFSLETTEEMLSLRLKHYEEYGFGVWAVIDKASGEMIGQTGLQILGSSWDSGGSKSNMIPCEDLGHENLLEGRSDVELVAYTAKRRWHDGVGYEASSGALMYGFKELNLPRILAVIRAVNAAGQKLAEKLGFRFMCEGKAYGFDVFYYQILKSEFIPWYGLYRVHQNGNATGRLYR